MLNMEKIMERHYVIKQCLEGKMNQTQAMAQLNLSRRQMYRILQNYTSKGIESLQHKHRSGRPPMLAVKKQVMQLIREKYVGFGATLISEYLRGDGYIISKETIRQWGIKEGIWKAKSNKNKPVHQSRARRARNGELIQIDGSHHDWFEGRADKCCLYVFIDDATSEIKWLHFAPKETTLGYMECVYNYVKIEGRPLAFYSDRHSIFTTTRPNSTTGHYDKTQFHRAVNDLDIALILAYSPQAKGRVERCNKTLQDRLVKELRLRNISDINDANRFLPEFMESFNARFAKIPADKKDAHRNLFIPDDKLKQILSLHYEKIVAKNCQIYFDNFIIKLNPALWQNRLTGHSVKICKSFDGAVHILFDNNIIVPIDIILNPNAPICADHKDLNLVLNNIISVAA